MAPRLLAALAKLVSRDRALSEEERQKAVRGHLARCENFRLLLAANSKALAVMAEMEEELRGDRVFGLAEIRAQVVDVCASVFRMARYLCALAPGRYQALFDRLAAIREAIDRDLRPDGRSGHGELVLDISAMEAGLAHEVGAKMATLGQARRLGLAVPRGFAVTASAYRAFMAHGGLGQEIDRLIQATDAKRPDEAHRLSSAIQTLVMRAEPPPELARALAGRVEALVRDHGPGLRLAVRSSALGEDAAGACFAGQYRTLLGVDPENALAAYKEVAASKYGVTAMAYRRARGIRDDQVDMCVGCLAMVEARAGGVVYTGNPVNALDRTVTVHAVPGLPVSVVDGSEAVDVFHLVRDPLRIVATRLSPKRTMAVGSPLEGVDRIGLAPSLEWVASLEPDQALEAASMALELEAHFQAPQDVEFAVDQDGSLVLLQCRPLTVLEPQAEDVAPMEPEEAPLARGGEACSPGAAWGPVCAVGKDVDLLSFPKGAVLLAESALPKWAPLLNRAVAVVTSRGSPAGHLANVAREFGVPALFGLPDAVNALRRAGVVTVDADGRAVYRGRIQYVLDRRARKPPNLMLGSPVHATLSRVAAHVVPLNLLDPRSPEFAPGSCRTLHDITRFCHEKAVWEMFESKRGLDPSGLGGRRLTFHGRPLAYWVVDLGGAFEKDAHSRKVALEQIRCPPFMALWRGMTAVPWQGPPALDAGGFMSVLAGSGGTGAPDPAAGGPLTQRSYLMVSPEYVNLQSRFGYHFSTVEAQISPSAPENYAVFQFKGGAADINRRVARAEMVRDLLEERGFATERREDNLYARMEGEEPGAMESGLAVLGHVLIHTRQVDMIMGSPDRAMALRRRLARELDALAANGAARGGEP